MSKIALCLSFVVALYVSCSAVAVEVKDLYLVKWPVAEQSKTARWKAALAGFKEVLVRKSGSEDILQTDLVQQSYSKVTSYLQRFEYTRTDDLEQDFPYTISLYFEPRLIDSLIQDSQMPLWGSNRPVSILWLAIQENYSRNLVTNAEQHPEIIEAIQKNSVRRGIPVILPLMDLEDELVVSISDVWGRFSTPILEASQRYSADSVVFGRISQQAQTWIGRFSYVNQNKETRFEIEAEDKIKLIQALTNRLADQLCEQYCVVEETGQKNEILMNITDVRNFEMYKSLENYLNQMSSIRSIKLISIDQEQVIFRLTLLGQIESLTEGIGLSQKLIPIETTEENPSADSRSEDTPAELANEPDADILTVPTESPVLDATEGQATDTKESNEIEPAQKPLMTLYYRWIG